MSKRRKTQYTRQRNRVTSYIRKLRKKGLEVDIYFPTELELRKAGVKGSELGALTRKLKQYTPEVLKQLATTIYKPTQEIKRKRESLKQEQEQENIPKISYIDKFKEKIDELFGRIEKFRDDVNELPEFRAFYHGRGIPATFKDLAPYKSLFLSLLDDRISENGEEEVERLLFEHSTEIEDKFSAITYDSKEQVVDFCLNSIATILKGSPLSLSENEMITKLSEGEYEIED